jgi:hypothetical protein
MTISVMNRIKIWVPALLQGTTATLIEHTSPGGSGICGRSVTSLFVRLSTSPAAFTVTWNERGTMFGYSLISGARAGSGFT